MICAGGTHIGSIVRTLQMLNSGWVKIQIVSRPLPDGIIKEWLYDPYLLFNFRPIPKVSFEQMKPLDEKETALIDFKNQPID